MNGSQHKRPRRRKDVYWIAGLAIASIVVFAVGAGYYARQKQQEPSRPQVASLPMSATSATSGTSATSATAATSATSAAAAPPNLIRPHSHALGPQDAKVTVVEFLDPECESCRAIYPAVKHLLKEYPGRLRLVVRIMPFHKNSPYAASALEAAARQGRYWEMLEILFVNQPRWGSHHDPKPELIPELARQLGLDMSAFTQSLNDPLHRERLALDQADGRQLGVTGTPTFFVNGRLLEQLGYEPLKQRIDEELAK